MTFNPSKSSLSAYSKRLVIHFQRFGPYHLARLSSARDALACHGWDVVGLETAGMDATYGWKSTTCDLDLQRITVFPEGVVEQISARNLSNGIVKALDLLQPSAVAIAGWSAPDALACAKWSQTHHSKSILMSETREIDSTRVWWKEWVKARRVSNWMPLSWR